MDEIPGLYREETAGLDPDRRVPMALDAERAATGSQAEVRRVESAGYGDAVTRMAVASTRGGPVGFGRTDCWAYAVALAERDGEVQTGFAYRLARSPDDLDPAEAGSEAAERAARLLGGTAGHRAPAGRPRPGGGHRVPRRAGRLAVGRIGPQGPIAPRRPGRRPGGERGGHGGGRRPPSDRAGGGPGGRRGRAPDEPARGGRRAAGFLHNTSTAARTGNGARSTGNAGRGTYRTPPAVRPANLYLVPGETRLADLLTRAGRAVYVQDVTGLHSGANPVSGEFSVGATGIGWRTGRSASRCGR